MRPTHLFPSLLLALPLLSQAADVSITMTGTIADVSSVLDGLEPGASTAQDIAAVKAVMGNLQAGQSFTLNYSFNTDSWQGTPQFDDPAAESTGMIFSPTEAAAGRIKVTFAVPDAGIAHVQDQPAGVNFQTIQTARTTPDGGGTTIVFHAGDSRANDVLTTPGTRIYDSTVGFVNLSGDEYKQSDLASILGQYSFSSAVIASGNINILDSTCTIGMGTCGYADFNVSQTTVTVTNVPEPTSAMTTALGLLGVSGAMARMRRRARGQKA